MDAPHPGSNETGRRENQSQTRVYHDSPDLHAPSFLDHALRYADLSWHIFPCVPGQKKPLTDHGFKDASNDPEIIREWWTRWPNANIGLATGRISGVAVTDEDVGTDKETGRPKQGPLIMDALQAEHGDLPPTVMQRTGGGGYQRFFAYPGNVVKIGTGTDTVGKWIDSRGDGGYTILPPSLHPDGGRYEWLEGCNPLESAQLAPLPEWIKAKLTPPKPKESEPRPRASFGDADNDLQSALNAIPADCNYTQWVNVGMALHASGELGAFNLWDQWSSRSKEKYPGTEVLRRKWDGFDPNRGLHRESIFAWAESYGWINPAKGKPKEADRPKSESKKDDNWRRQLKTRKVVSPDEDQAFVPTKCLHNTLLILSNDPYWKGRIRYDEFGCRIMLDGRPWQDEDGILAAAWMHSSEHDMNVSSEMIEKAVTVVARSNAYHPVKDYLNGLTWDKTPRLDNWLIRHLGAEDSLYTKAVAKCTLIAAVARIFQPGCKSKYVLYLDGEQDIGKSTAVESLCPDPQWFTDEMSNIGNKDAIIDMAGKWIIELSELQAIRGKDAAITKSFISRTTDRCRTPYDRHARDFPRQCIFIATTNPDHTLNDATGNVRWWPVNCEFANADAIRADRDQLWAEAVHLYRQGAQWHITDPAVLALAKEAQSEKEYRHAWTDRVEEFLEGKDFVTMEEVLRVVGMSSSYQVAKDLECTYATPKEQGEVRATMLRLGWRSKRPWREINGEKRRVPGYVPKKNGQAGQPMSAPHDEGRNRITVRAGQAGQAGQPTFKKINNGPLWMPLCLKHTKIGLTSLTSLTEPVTARVFMVSLKAMSA